MVIHHLIQIPARFFSLCFLLCIFLACGDEKLTPETWKEAISHKNLGLAYLDRNDYQSAVAEFESVIKLIPSDPVGYANLAVAHLKLQNAEAAIEPIEKAMAINNQDAAIYAIHADVVAARGDLEKAVGILEEALQFDGTNVLVRYKYLKMLQKLRGPSQQEVDTIEQLQLILVTAQDNVAILAELAESLIRTNQAADALTAYITIQSLMDPISENIKTYLDATMTALGDNDMNEARRAAGILANLLKIDPAYRASRDALGDPSQQHPPLYDFRTAPFQLAMTAADTLIPLSFKDVTAEMFATDTTSGIQSITPDQVVLSDYDADGALDLIVVAERGIHIFHQSEDQWHNVTATSGLEKLKFVKKVALGDIDDDGDQDVFLMRDGIGVLYQFNENKVFSNLRKSKFQKWSGRNPHGLFADYDHDGDLDILYKDERETFIFRNVADGVFEEITSEAGLIANQSKKRDVKNSIFSSARMITADLDQDGAMDLFIPNDDGQVRMYRNIRQGQFVDWTNRARLGSVPPGEMVIADDFNNDGAPDLFIAGGENASCVMLWNNGDGTFDTESTPALLSNIYTRLKVTSIHHLDFDNDGFLDLVLAGLPTDPRGGMSLIRNLGNGRFEDVSSLIPTAVQVLNIYDVDVGDSDRDGDIDLHLATENGLVVLRNEGGNANQWLNVQLVAARNGSGKNNLYGLGAQIELNTETHYQSRLVTSTTTHLGLGSHDNADVMRVLWPNGIPQNRVKPETNTRIVEQQRLKGSCPSLYTWNGEKYVFVTHLMTRSAIGALNEMGGTAFPDAANDYVKIRGDQLKEKDGKLTINVVEELWDAVYMDNIQLLVIDHPVETDIYVDEKYVPPPYPDFQIHTATTPRLPQSAVDHHGHDILSHLSARDTLYVGDFTPGEYQGLPETHTITVGLGDLKQTDKIQLYLCGWIMPIEPSSNLALSQRGGDHVIAPYLEVPDERGRWHKVIDYTGFPSGEHKTMMVDLTGKFLADDYRIRITTNLQIYWSDAFFTVNEPDQIPHKVTPLSPETADLHYRGYSREYQVTPLGPFLRDYNVVSTAPQWLPFEGYRTRYGDIAPLLQKNDNQYAIFSSGEEVSITFNASNLPSLPEGWTRDYILHSDGWLKEGDLNTDTAATIVPLPFHGMTKYPYGKDEEYPNTSDVKAYQAEYNTRWVSQKKFRQEIRRIGDGLEWVDE